VDLSVPQVFSNPSSPEIALLIGERSSRADFGFNTSESTKHRNHCNPGLGCEVQMKNLEINSLASHWRWYCTCNPINTMRVDVNTPVSTFNHMFAGFH
jgi:hypothetical protein